MISVSELKSAITQRIAQLDLHRDVCHVALDGACHQILAHDVMASLDLPRQNLSAMDGFAFGVGSDVSELACLSIIGESCAGKPFMGRVAQNQGVRIFTGAVVPDDCDTVVMQEHTNFLQIKDGLDKLKPYDITLTKTATLGDNIRRQGEEITQGERLLMAHKRLNPSDVSLLASMGVDKVAVFAPLVVGIIATGDELVAIGQPLTSLAQIYNANTPTLKALLGKLPITIKDYGIIADDYHATLDMIKMAISECDVIISSAGVSVGDYDFLTKVVDELGKINHYKVAMKPGKPFVFGEFCCDNKTVMYFGLPGNPLSAVVGCLQFVRPALWQLSGSMSVPTFRLNAKATQAIKKRAGRQEFLRAVFDYDDGGDVVVTPLSSQDSHRVKGLSIANCLLVLDKDNAGVQAGDVVVIEPFDWIL
ncbi:MAG: molybdopterin molybdotransferase MoeA [Moraxella sp.]|nr:molybdopterin molybdotransferase MoeA [Moraxella sp.]